MVFIFVESTSCNCIGAKLYLVIMVLQIKLKSLKANALKNKYKHIIKENNDIYEYL